MAKVGRPETGQGLRVTLYLNLDRLSLLGEEPKRKIFELIDGLKGVVDGEVGASASELRVAGKRD